ncbi:MAG: NAD(P)(+) transhydrogenase (Re/Si-specific) subunit beta [Acidobacteriota bacterium]|nr:NAD(P)(+) transhydrogenase (Re/Si-specific) subunit beta [Acidobacteriota bacterium]
MTPLVFYLVSLGLVAGVVWGIHLMNKPQTAVRGNLLGALCLLGSIVLTMTYYGILDIEWLWISMAVGGVIGYIWSAWVKMIKMPQLVAVFNGFGGCASSLVAFLLLTGGRVEKGFSLITAAIALAIGALTFSGSMIAAAKLNQWITQRPIVVKKHSAITNLSLCFLGVLLVMIVIAGDPGRNLLTALIAATSLFIGLFFTLRVGGADMPITISLLNSFSGVAGAIAGMAIRDPLLVAVGGVVGASGLLLTQVMCRAMNRNVFDVLSGRTAVQSERKPVVIESRADESVPAEAAAADETEHEKEESAESAFRDARRVVIVQGYGLALSQAQHLVKKLADRLEELGKDVKYAIHPVAGRMPGHMNVLLAEADVPYEQLCEMDDINPHFKETDVVLVVGANDVVNPSAISAKGTPIYGMPILQVDEARRVVICNWDDKPGYSGVDNPLYRKKHVTLMLGDAAESLSKIISCLED